MPCEPALLFQLRDTANYLGEYFMSLNRTVEACDIHYSQAKSMHELKFLHELELYGSEFLILYNTFVPAFTKDVTSRKSNIIKWWLFSICMYLSAVS